MFCAHAKCSMYGPLISRCYSDAFRLMLAITFYRRLLNWIAQGQLGSSKPLHDCDSLDAR
jgi:hypothetical protein